MRESNHVNYIEASSIGVAKLSDGVMVCRPEQTEIRACYSVYIIPTWCHAVSAFHSSRFRKSTKVHIISNLRDWTLFKLLNNSWSYWQHIHIYVDNSCSYFQIRKLKLQEKLNNLSKVLQQRNQNSYSHMTVSLVHFVFIVICYKIWSHIQSCCVCRIHSRKLKVKVALLCPTVCKPMDYTVHGLLQARMLE